MERGKERAKQRSEWSWVLHVFVLWSLAAAQPIYDLLGQYPEFFVARRTVPVELLALALSLSFLIPASLVLGLAVLRRLSGAAFRMSLTAGVAGLAAAALLPVVKRLPLSGPPVVVIALTGGLLVGFLYPRLFPFRLFLGYLAPVVVIFPAYFLFFTPVEALVFPGQWTSSPVKPGIAGKETRSVVILVLDELALFSLLDEKGQIDGERFPNFAALASESIWFRNATTVAESTHNSIPAIATGLYPSLTKLGNSRDYPENLFTWLSPTHELHVFESITQLCPVQLCAPKIKAGWTKRAKLLGEDLSVVYGHLLTPEDMSGWLPDIRQGWGNFRNNDWQLARSLAFYEGASSLDPLLTAVDESRRPALFFYHAPLPHFPWVYLPSGDRYAKHSLAELFLNKDRWTREPEVVAHAFQRYLLQLGYTDHELGRLMAKLRETGLADEAILLVLSDHGLDFVPGRRRRSADSTTARAIMPIPVFLRMPGGGRAAVSEANLETVDLLPTLSDLLDIPLPWSTDGVSAMDRARKKPVKLLYKQGIPDPLVFSADLSTRAAPALCLDGEWLEADPSLVGSVDHVAVSGERVAISGFAADLPESEPADRVLVFVDGELAHVVYLGRERQDVAEFFDDPGLLGSGFLLILDRSFLRGDPNRVVRFFGQRGRRMSELQYQAGYPWNYDTTPNRLDEAIGETSCSADSPFRGRLVIRKGLALGSETGGASDRLLALARGAGPNGVFRGGPGAKYLGLASSALPPGTRPISVRLSNPRAFEDVRHNSGFVPAEIDAAIDVSALSERGVVAVALNGVVRATAVPFSFEEGARILTIVPEEHFVEGANRLDFFVVPPQTQSPNR